MQQVTTTLEKLLVWVPVRSAHQTENVAHQHLIWREPSELT